MDAWSDYEALRECKGKDRRTRSLNRERAYIGSKLPNSLSYKTVLIDGVETNVAITGKNDLSKRNIFSMPGETLIHGGIVDYADSKWIITSIKQENEVYQKGLLEQCNHLLKWLDKDGHIVEKWCIVADGTKYLIGEKSEDIISIGDARIAVTVPKDDDTKHLKRGMRFLIDDTDAEEILAYEITKSNRLYNIYNGKGVYRFILKEDNTTDKDNLDLRIADYYKFYLKDEDEVLEEDPQSNTVDKDNEKNINESGWL